jgi:hypothetical protein
MTAAQTCAAKQHRHSGLHENDSTRLTATLIRTGSLGRDMKYVHACRTTSDGWEERLWHRTLACAQPTDEGESAYSMRHELSETYHPIACTEL